MMFFLRSYALHSGIMLITSMKQKKMSPMSFKAQACEMLLIQMKVCVFVQLFLVLHSEAQTSAEHLDSFHHLS